MDDSMDTEPEKLTKQDKKEKKKVEKAAVRIEKELEVRDYLKISIFIMGIIDCLVLVGVTLLTANIFSIVLPECIANHFYLQL